MDEIETVYRVYGKIFNTKNDAENYVEKMHNLRREINVRMINLWKEELKEQLIQEYLEKNLPLTSCQCPSDKCLVHFCTCRNFEMFPEKHLDPHRCAYHYGSKNDI